MPTGQRGVDCLPDMGAIINTIPGFEKSLCGTWRNQIALSALPSLLILDCRQSGKWCMTQHWQQVVPNDKTIFAYSGNKAMVIGGVDYGLGTSRPRWPVVLKEAMISGIGDHHRMRIRKSECPKSWKRPNMKWWCWMAKKPAKAQW